MVHKFDVKRAAILEDEERIRLINPSHVFRVSGIGKGAGVADVGCGTGVFSILLSRIVGEGGVIYAVDVEKEMLTIVEEKMRKEGLVNIKPILSTESNIPLPMGSVDHVLLVDTLHELEGQPTLKEIYRILRLDGTFTVVEWKKIPTSMGPPLSERIASQEAVEMLEKLDFKPRITADAGPEHYLIIATKV